MLMAWVAVQGAELQEAEVEEDSSHTHDMLVVVFTLILSYYLCQTMS